ncbi:DUF1801 domain-containing protein [Cognatishimia sp. F0-27]|uniref:DUF1801 domain-containing protein n=1 Tax=Cognatishimia sp. F0-27 TaxID=2816855 RepID=UPI001D0C104C|nr:DUF1801 domain-containing protein [Cognatishimia sp. F0-27]MCC1491605.1 DUF1801 domain-containing protein [Cognatishimia sp. F0-27]
MKPTTIDAFHAALPPEDRVICDRLRAIIDGALPDAQSKIWHAHPVWFLSGNPIVGYGRLKSGPRLLFWSGQSFETAGLVPSGRFKAAEIRYGSAAAIKADRLEAWLDEARRIQWDYKNIVKRKGQLLRLV